MRFGNLLFICLATATLTSMMGTAESWYNGLTGVVHSGLESIEGCYKKLKTASYEYSKGMIGAVKNQITKRQDTQPVKYMRDFVERMKGYATQAKKIACREAGEKKPVVENVANERSADKKTAEEKEKKKKDVL